jgi:hypothetical protein
VVTSNGDTVCAASFHLPAVRTAKTNTVQHPTPHQQYETPTVPAVVMSKVLLSQSINMAAFVHSHCNLFIDIPPALQHTLNMANKIYSGIPYRHLIYDIFVKCNCVNNRLQ